jgi:hypothetical protein
MSVPSSPGSPTRIVETCRTSRSRNSSATGSVTMTREVAVHFCPVDRNAPATIWSTARSRSASVRTNR